MTVASRAVMMTDMTEVRMMGMIDVEQEGHTSHWNSMHLKHHHVIIKMSVCALMHAHAEGISSGRR